MLARKQNATTLAVNRKRSTKADQSIGLLHRHKLLRLEVWDAGGMSLRSKWVLFILRAAGGVTEGGETCANKLS